MTDVDARILAAAGLELSRGEGPEAGRCGVCGDPVGPSARTCPACDAPHHEDCWIYNEGCTTYGCTEALKIAEALEPSAPAPSPAPAGAGAAPALPRSDAGPGRSPEEDSWSLRIQRALQENLSARTPLELVVIAAAVLGTFQLVVAPSGVELLLFTFLVLVPLGAVGMAALAFHAILGPGPRLGAPRLRSLADEDVKRLEATLAASPDDLDRLQDLALVLFAQRDWKRAKGLYDRILAREPENPGALFRQARVLEELGARPAARALLERLASLGEDLPFVRSARARLERRRRLEADRA